MNNLVWLILVPLGISVIILVLEYAVLQPLAEKRSDRLPNVEAVGDDWYSAIKSAIQAFKSQQSGYKWSKRHNTLTVEEWELFDDQAVLVLAVYKDETVIKQFHAGFSMGPEPVLKAGYRLRITQAGRIVSMKSIPVIQTVGSHHARLDLSIRGFSPKVSLSEPVAVTRDGDINVVTFRFVIGNPGRSGTIQPVLTYRTRIRNRDGKIHDIERVARFEPMAISAQSVQPIILTDELQGNVLPGIETADDFLVDLCPVH